MFLNLLLGFMFHHVLAGLKKLNVSRQNAFKKHIKAKKKLVKSDLPLHGAREKISLLQFG